MLCSVRSAVDGKKMLAKKIFSEKNNPMKNKDFFKRKSTEN